MTNTAVLVDKGLRVLEANLGTVEAERFIYTIKTENFDYTKWQQEQYADISAEDFVDAAAEYMAHHPELKPKNAKTIVE